MTENIYKNMGISDALYNYASEVLQELEPRFAEIDKMAEINQMKVLAAMQKNQVSEACKMPWCVLRLPAEPMPLHWH